MENVETSIAERFEKIVRLHPDRLAVKDRDQSLTYDQLNRHANRIARAILDKRGPGSEPIALLFEHGIDIIAATLGVLKAGKFYAALDLSWPPEQTRNILLDAEPGLIVSNNKNLSLARDLSVHGCEILDIQQSGGLTPAHELPVAISPDYLASIIYTSGSTGKPKGIILNQAQVVQFASLGATERSIQPEDRLSLLHHCSLGAASTHLFQSLLNGASLFPFDIKSAGVLRLVRYLAEEQITVLSLAPSLFRQCVPVLAAHRYPLTSLRLITLVGAPVTRIDFEYYKEHCNRGTLLEIFFGSTEAGAISSALINHDFSYPEEGFPLGYACRGKNILLLDEEGHGVGFGERGEIAVEGDTLHLGYWRQPKLTAEKFIQRTGGASDKLCLTGDLGMMRPDGFLIYLGRKDDQVKIRGYRVELGAIENAVLRHPAVREAAVIARDDHQGETFLVAYIVPTQSEALAINEVRAFLKSRLPDYMIPSRFVFLSSLPLTPSGKLDRNSLPEPNWLERAADSIFVAPRTPTEKQLAQIWAEVLKVDRISIHDNFFDLGGHSLTAMKILAAMTDAFGFTLSMRDLLDAPTVAGLTALVAKLMELKEPSRLSDQFEEEDGEI